MKQIGLILLLSTLACTGAGNLEKNLDASSSATNLSLKKISGFVGFSPLAKADVHIVQIRTNQILTSTTTDEDGFFEANVIVEPSDLLSIEVTQGYYVNPLDSHVHENTQPLILVTPYNEEDIYVTPLSTLHGHLFECLNRDYPQFSNPYSYSLSLMEDLFNVDLLQEEEPQLNTQNESPSKNMFSLWNLAFAKLARTYNNTPPHEILHAVTASLHQDCALVLNDGKGIYPKELFRHDYLNAVLSLQYDEQAKPWWDPVIVEQVQHIRDLNNFLFRYQNYEN